MPRENEMPVARKQNVENWKTEMYLKRCTYRIHTFIVI